MPVIKLDDKRISIFCAGAVAIGVIFVAGVILGHSLAKRRVSAELTEANASNRTKDEKIRALEEENRVTTPKFAASHTKSEIEYRNSLDEARAAQERLMSERKVWESKLTASHDTAVELEKKLTASIAKLRSILSPSDFTAWQAAEEVRLSPIKALSGTWRGNYLEIGGVVQKPNDQQEGVWIFEPNGMAVLSTAGAADARMRWRVNTDFSPPFAIDIGKRDVDPFDTVMRGIWKIEDGVLTMCISSIPDKRPTRFNEGTPENAYLVVKLRKDK